jgi:hypothetical protein
MVLFLVLMPYHLGLFVVCEEVFPCIKGVYNAAMPSKGVYKLLFVVNVVKALDSLV